MSVTFSQALRNTARKQTDSSVAKTLVAVADAFDVANPPVVVDKPGIVQKVVNAVTGAN